MLKRTKRIIAFILAIQIIWGNSFMVPLNVFASEQPQVDVVEEWSDDSSEQKKEEHLINYVVLESNNLKTPSEQQIVISIGADSIVIQSAELTIKNRTTGRKYFINSDKINEDGILFKIMHSDASESGVYELTNITYVIENEKHKITMSEAGMNIEYGVNTEVESKEDAIVLPEEDYSDNIVITDLNAMSLSDNTLKDALEINAKSSLMSLKKKSELVVVIDPGHGGTNPGAIHQGLYEKNLTLKIAQYFKEELETYNNVKVYLTRTSDITLELKERADIAKEYGADVLLSVHLDASTNSSVKGASVYYPNANYNSEVHEEGKKIAAVISEKLEDLGLANRGIIIRNAVDDKYDDGTAADYYGIIRHSKLNGFPGLIIEHGFLSNKDDVNNFMSTDEKLKNLGVADATAIAEFYGLTKDVGNTVATVTSSVSADGTKVQLTAKEIPNAKKVQFAVWSDKYGQDDLYWYTATKDAAGNFVAEVPLSNHKTAGSYTVHVYGEFNGLGSIGVGTSQFAIEGPKLSEIQIGKVTSDDKFRIELKGVTSQSPIELVQVPVWSKADQSDIVWYTAQKTAEGTYVVDVELFRHNYNAGVYTIHVYATDKNKINTAIGTAVTERIEVVPQSTLIASSNSTQTSYNLKVLPGLQTNNYKSVRFAVWSVKGGQDDIVWYSGKKMNDGSWSVDVPISNHKTVGQYLVHVYGDTASANQVFINDTTFEVTPISTGAISVANQEDSKGTFQLVVKGVNAPSGVKNLQIAVWSRSNQSDIYWYTGEKQKNGDYIVNVDIAKHNYNYGTYIAHAYATDGNDIFQFTCDTTVALEQPEVKVSAAANANQTVFSLKTSLIPFNSSVSNVKFAVWSEKNGQDDIIWYSGDRGKDATWSVNVPISNHKTLGKYIVHVYARMSSGEDKFIDDTTFEVEAMTKANVTTSSVNAGNGTFQLNISGLTSKSGIQYVDVPVWTQSNQSDLSWYRAVKQSNGTYVVTVDIKYHDYNYGSYIADVYATDGNGIQQYVGGNVTQIEREETKVQAVGNDTQSIFDLSIMNVPLIEEYSSVRFAVWSEKGGQDDITWYSGSKVKEGTWNVKVPISNHKTSGVYYVHVYGTRKNGQMRFLSDTTFKVDEITKGKVSISQLNNANGTFRVTVDDVSVPSGIKKVLVPVWSQSNQSDLIWYTAVKEADGSYVVDVDIKDHGYNYATYIVDVYATDGNGITKNLSSTTATMKKPEGIVSTSFSADNATATLKIQGVPYPGITKTVEFAVWSSKDGQDDLIWYKATKAKDGSWSVNVPLNNHKTEGEYIVHVYSTLENGDFTNVGSSTFNVQPSTYTVTTQIQDVDVIEGDFSIVVTIANASRGVSKVQVPVWSNKDQSDIVWYEAHSIGNGKYLVRVEQENHNNRTALYTAHVYVTDLIGITKSVASTSYELTALYEVMGTSNTSVQQMVKYYNSKQTYPAFYKTTDAPTIEDFCRIFLEECAIEGVRAEVAFCQTMKETGFLKFGGDVKIDQFNFAGLGATGNGAPGESFSSVRIGIRAQIQHLKAYASDLPLQQTCVDTRFKYVVRNSAQFVEWLGIYENPNTVFAADGSIILGRGWAMAKRYGYSIINDYIAQLLKY